VSVTPPPKEPEAGGLILVVDDQEANRQLLHDMLELDGHHVLEADNGLTALALAAEHDPDAVLLDVTMPGLDGFEVCRRLRAAPRTSATPVLLITALVQREHRLQGMAAGANDYLVKPIDRSEVTLRVRNAVRMRVMHRTLQVQFTELQRMERLRDDLVSMVAHDLRSPLTGLRGYLELLQEELHDQLSPSLGGMLSEAVRAVVYPEGACDAEGRRVFAQSIVKFIVTHFQPHIDPRAFRADAGRGYRPFACR